MTSKRTDFFEGIRLFVLTTWAAAFGLTVTASSTAAESYRNGIEMERASDFYQNGNLEKSIDLLDKILTQDPSNRKAKKLLTEVLVVSSVESYLLGDDEDSFQALSKALKISPDAKTVHRMYEKIKKERFGTNPEKRKGLPSTGVTYQSTLTRIIRRQNQLIHSTQETLEKVAQSVSEEKKQVLKSLEQQEALLMEGVQRSKSFSLWAVAGGVLLLLSMVGMILYVIGRIAERREQAMIQQGERVMQMLSEQATKALEKISEKTTSLPPPQPAVPQQKFIEKNTDEKLHQIDIIDAEIIQDSSGVSAKTLAMESLLEDSNPEVRARAIQVLLKYDLDQAYRRIDQMVNSQDAESRSVGAQILGGIATPKSAKTLIDLLKDKEESVKRDSIVSLQTLLNENLNSSVKDEIHLALGTMAQEEGWIS